MLDSQRLASDAVLKTLGGRNLTQTLNDIWRNNPTLTPQQKGSIQDLSYGVFRYYGILQALLDLLLNKPLKDKPVQALLLVALYQLQYTHAPEHAIVNHAVDVSRNYSGQVRSLVNAILRNFLRRKAELLEHISRDETAIFNHPEWWIDKLKIQYPAHFKDILEIGNTRPPMTLRVNKRKTTLDAYESMLKDRSMDYTVLSDCALMLKKPVSIEKLPGFAAGLVSIQDRGAQWAAPLLDLQHGMTVLDACAAPGGKSAHILETCDVDLLSLDNSPSRSRQIVDNFSRLGIMGRVETGDAASPESWWDGKPFQRILADVPCSASGVVRRHPDIKWLRRPDDIPKFAQQQRVILEALWKTLASGGKLLYSTCSVFKEENAVVVADFIKKHEGTVLLALNDEIPDGQLLPNDLHDGFFYALLQKK